MNRKKDAGDLDIVFSASNADKCTALKVTVKEV